jgi:hypothetical protein
MLLAGLMLLEMQNVPVVPVNELCNGRVQPLSIRALHQQNRAIPHSPPPMAALLYAPNLSPVNFILRNKPGVQCPEMKRGRQKRLPAPLDLESSDLLEEVHHFLSALFRVIDGSLAPFVRALANAFRCIGSVPARDIKGMFRAVR